MDATNPPPTGLSTLPSKLAANPRSLHGEIAKIASRVSKSENRLGPWPCGLYPTSGPSELWRQMRGYASIQATHKVRLSRICLWLDRAYAAPQWLRDLGLGRTRMVGLAGHPETREISPWTLALGKGGRTAGVEGGALRPDQLDPLIATISISSSSTLVADVHFFSL